ncbi:S-methyl-5-thioribose-1-phosphate isomerase [Candidatus Gracilibacteria bacterium]|nr:S-methyl-5-thioribose-1-phosphate isomerase [Candidatus Gracilibacteria bacterium]
MAKYQNITKNINDDLLKLNNVFEIAKDIKSISIQGATNIAREGIKILGIEISKQKFGSLKELEKFLFTASSMLSQARETEPMLFNGLTYCKQKYYERLKKTNNIKTLQDTISKAAKDYVEEIQKEEKIRPIIGEKTIKSKYNIMTHCHSGSVIKILTTAWSNGKEIHVYNTETRPLYQGRKTSNDLVNAGVPNTMITDSSAPFFTDNIHESHVNIDMVIIGSDAIKLNGSVYNKIGSFSIALAARHSKIPVYIVGSLLKIDTENTVKIEVRDGKELRPDRPQGLEIINYAFDMVPAKFITGIITEFGIIKPKDLKKAIKKHYPRMLTKSKNGQKNRN